MRFFYKQDTTKNTYDKDDEGQLTTIIESVVVKDQLYEYILSPDGKGSIQQEAFQTEIDELVESGDAILCDSLQQVNEAMTYIENRIKEYPAIQDQLDQIFHEGIDAWKETIQAVKDANPKPE
jgi:hypothetical protein